MNENTDPATQICDSPLIFNHSPKKFFASAPWLLPLPSIRVNNFITNLMKKILLSCSAVLFCFSLIAQTNASLKLNLEKNKVYRFNSTSSQTIIQTINGNQQTVESEVDYTLSIKMIDATPDFMITEIHIDTMKTNTNSMGKTTSMSSNVAGDIKSAEMSDVVSCIMNRLSKNALYVKMDYSGKPLEIVNSKMLSDVILKDTSSITLSGAIGLGVKKQVANMISDNTLKTLIEMFTWFLPGKQVSAGDSWDITVNSNSGGMALDITTSYHLDDISGNSANITAQSAIKTAYNAAPIIAGGAKITYDDLKGISKSDMVVDILTGLVKEARSKTHIAGNMGVSAPGMSMQIPMDISGESKVAVLQ